MEEKNIRLQQEVKECAHSMGRWYKFFAVVYIVSAAIMLAAGVLMVTVGGMFESAMEKYPFPLWVMGVLYLVCAAVEVPAIVYLFRAAKACREAVGFNNNEAAARFMRHSKSYWKYIGILTIVMLGLTVLVMVAGSAYGIAVAM